MYLTPPHHDGALVKTRRVQLRVPYSGTGAKPESAEPALLRVKPQTRPQRGTAPPPPRTASCCRTGHDGHHVQLTPGLLVNLASNSGIGPPNSSNVSKRAGMQTATHKGSSRHCALSCATETEPKRQRLNPTRLRVLQRGSKLGANQEQTGSAGANRECGRKQGAQEQTGSADGLCGGFRTSVGVQPTDTSSHEPPGTATRPKAPDVFSAAPEPRSRSRHLHTAHRGRGAVLDPRPPLEKLALGYGRCIKLMT